MVDSYSQTLTLTFNATLTRISFFLILFAAFFFGLMKTIASAYSVIPILSTASIPSDIYKMVPFIATLIVLAFSSKKSQAPKAIAVPYDKGSR